jgi:ABC-type nitrate/sulfonate/bicarbonate transport system ATPase subunit
MVRLEGVGVRYSTSEGPVPAVEGFDAELPRGTITAVIGASGCGKTSLIRAMAGLVRPAAGRIEIEGEDLGGVRPSTSVIFQEYGLLPWKTVEANAELPLLIRGARGSARRAVTRPLLEELGLSGFLRQYPGSLSGGMRQRLAIARSLSTTPDLLLMDEPFSSLDALTRESMQEMLLAVHARHGTTVVIVTHSIEEAVALSDTVLVMRGRNPGRLARAIRVGRPRREEPRFLEMATLLRGLLSGGEAA